MRSGILRIIALILLFGTMSSCYKNSYSRFHGRKFYGERKHYYRHHHYRNGGW